jgi:hypothetical protein
LNTSHSDLSETVITQSVSVNDRRQARAAGMTLVDKNITFRLIKLSCAAGTSKSLRRRSSTHQPIPRQLSPRYACWNLEEAFKRLKYQLYLEQFTGELLESIRQDVYAKIFTANLTEALRREVYDTLPEDKAVSYLPNVSHILNSLKTRLFDWLIQCLPHDQVLELIALYARPLKCKRPDRKRQA